MKIGEILFFAPGIRFSEVDLNGSGLPEQFRRRVTGFYVEPAEECAQRGWPFAAGVLLVSCIDALARLRFGDRVRKRFRKFAAEELESFSDADLTERFYDEFRNGLVHEGRLKKGGQFSLEVGKTVELLDGILLVNPKYLADEVRSALGSYVTLVEGDDAERQRLAGALSQDLAEDFRVAGA